jgi:uncharacterized protein
MIFILLVFATFITSIISGVLSMAGGMVLMGVFSFVLSVPAAMVLHGTAQTFSNASRMWLHRRHIRWNIMFYYSIGALIVLAIFSAISFVPSIGIIFIIIGSFPIIAFNLPKSINLNMEKKPIAFVSGLLVTASQMLAGASGPVMDMFFVKSNMTRHEIIGTKAVTQTFGHILKLVYYTIILKTVTTELSLWVFVLVPIAALAGNWIGKIFIEKITDEHFKLIGRYVICTIGVIYIGKGVSEIFL